MKSNHVWCLAASILHPAHVKDGALALTPVQPGGTARPLSHRNGPETSCKKGLKQIRTGFAEAAL